MRRRVATSAAAVSLTPFLRSSNIGTGAPDQQKRPCLQAWAGRYEGLGPLEATRRLPARTSRTPAPITGPTSDEHVQPPFRWRTKVARDPAAIQGPSLTPALRSPDG